GEHTRAAAAGLDRNASCGQRDEVRFVVTTFMAFLVLTVLPLSGSARAVPGYDSDYADESAFFQTAPGRRAIHPRHLREDKTTCNVLSPDAAWNDGGWLSQIAYATTTQDVVAPNQLGTFSYNIKPPFGIEH